jgi:hypothetical protein
MVKTIDRCWAALDSERSAHGDWITQLNQKIRVSGLAFRGAPFGSPARRGNQQKYVVPLWFDPITAGRHDVSLSRRQSCKRQPVDQVRLRIRIYVQEYPGTG